MASFGGTVKLTGEAEYRKALSQITQNLRETSSALNLVDSQYSKNDNSIATVTAKNEKLNAILEKQKSAYENLKNSFTNIKAKYDEQVNSHSKLQAEYDKEKAKLETLKNTVGENSSAYEKQKAKVGELATQLSKSQSNIDANENAMSRLRIQMNNAEASINKTSNEIDNLGKETKETTEDVKQAGDGFTVFKGILANLGTQAINSAINGLKSLGGAFISVGKQALDSYADYEQLVGGVETLFGTGGLSVEEYAKKVGKSVGEVQEEWTNLDTAQSDVLYNAQNAFKTAGLSANEYMETVTSFSASLVASLGGDTLKASAYADRAITDMSDNANKMGTSIEMIQNAYQGFAKQNYTMLDNLKLGYGGTKEEMARLIADASKMTDVQKELNLTVDESDMSFGNIVNAISVVQKNMGIMGTTAKEASTTISGSVSSMKAAWQNLLTGIADDSADFGTLINNLVDSLIGTVDEGGNRVGGVLQNILPRVEQILQGISQVILSFATTILPLVIQSASGIMSNIVNTMEQQLPTILYAGQEIITTLVNGISSFLPQLGLMAGQIIMSLATTLIQNLPQIIDTGLKTIISFIQGITDALPQLVEMLPDVIKQTVDVLVDNLPLIIDTGIALLFALIDGITEALPTLIDYLPEIIDKVVMAITDNLPKLVEAGITLIIKLAEGLIQALPQLISKIPQIMGSLMNGIINYYGRLGEIGRNLLSKMISGIGSMLGSLGAKAGEIGTTIINKIKNLPSQMLNWGKDMIQGLINGIKGMVGKVGDAVKGIADKIKNFLHFSRPDEGPLREYETWMPDFINGLSNSLKNASPELINQTRALASDMSSAFIPNLSLNGSYSDLNGTGSINYQDNYNSIVEAFKTALSEMKIELDDENMGKFIDSTVARTIYS